MTAQRMVTLTIFRHSSSRLLRCTRSPETRWWKVPRVPYLVCSWSAGAYTRTHTQKDDQHQGFYTREEGRGWKWEWKPHPSLMVCLNLDQFEGGLWVFATCCGWNMITETLQWLFCKRGTTHQPVRGYLYASAFRSSSAGEGTWIISTSDSSTSSYSRYTVLPPWGSDSAKKVSSVSFSPAIFFLLTVCMCFFSQTFYSRRTPPVACETIKLLLDDKRGNACWLGVLLHTVHTWRSGFNHMVF